jgi:hypothetical protein
MRNFGKLHYNPVIIPTVYMYQTEVEEARGDPKVVMIPEKTVHQLADASDTPWKDVDLGTVAADDWWIAVEADGFICCCEKDPSLISIDNRDIWQISHPGPRDAIFCQIWTGKEVVPYVTDQP